MNLPNNFPYLAQTVQYLKKRNRNIVTFNQRTYADYCLFLHPAEWAGIPYFVNLVITDRFHGSVFGFRNNTPVVGIDMNPKRVSLKNSSKIKNLFEQYGVLENYINFFDQPSEEKFFQVIDKAMGESVNFDGVNGENAVRYMDFLRRCSELAPDGLR